MQSSLKQIENLKVTLKNITSQKMNVEDRIRQLEEMLEVEKNFPIHLL